MPIPRVVYQTYSSYAELPLILRHRIKRMLRLCPGYTYEFYDDERVARFISSEYDERVFAAYRRIAIGAAKADFFRYAVLLKRGGVYLDVDSAVRRNLDEMIRPDDEAVISREGNPGLYVQWALVFAPSHPFLAAALEKVVANIEADRYPDDVHRMTGPSVFTEAVLERISFEGTSLRYREFGTDYEGYFQFKQPASRLLYLRRPHWRKVQRERGVLNPIHCDHA